MKLLKPLTSHKFTGHLDNYFRKIQAKKPSRPLQIRVFSQKLGLDYTYPADSASQAYHIASIGKMFTATLTQMLAEKHLLSIDDSIQRFFSPQELEQLFSFQGVDYASQVTIMHLLGHTSGIADYFEGKTTNGKSFIYEILSNPKYHWTPEKLIDFTRNYQSAVGVPGKVFNYSDTGYILLGLIIEKVTGKSFADNLQDEFFIPLDMRDSYLLFYSEPTKQPSMPIEKIWFNELEVSGFESLSCDWSGGGIVSTTADLLKFNQALRSGRFLQSSTIEAMDACRHKFRPGIYYGLGMMEIRFSEFFFLLGRLPRIKGHIGVLSTHLFYDSTRDAHIIMNFGSNTRMVESFKALIQIENILQRIVEF